MTERLRVAYQGAPGAFGDEAIARYWGSRAVAVGVPSFRDAVLAVRGGTVRYAVLPAWNSTIGRIADAWHAISEDAEPSPPVRAIGELTIPVRHALLARAGVPRECIRSVLGHPAALAQCRRVLADRGLRAVVAEDSAGAARALARGPSDDPIDVPGCDERLDPRSTATLAPLRAAALYGLTVLDAAVQDRPDNRTSFLVLEARR